MPDLLGVAAALVATPDTRLWGAPSAPARRVIVTWAATAQQLVAAQPGDLFVCRAHPFFASPTGMSAAQVVDAATWAFRSSDDPVARLKRAALVDSGAGIVWAPELWDADPASAARSFAQQVGIDVIDGSAGALAVMAPRPLEEVLRAALPLWGAEHAMVVGDPAAAVSRVVFVPGLVSPRVVERALRDDRAEAIVCGEVVQWEAGPYVQDARALGASVSIATVTNVVSDQTANPLVATAVSRALEGLGVPVEEQRIAPSTRLFEGVPA